MIEKRGRERWREIEVEKREKEGDREREGAWDQGRESHIFMPPNNYTCLTQSAWILLNVILTSTGISH